jgi:uncharacterized membrane protein
MLEEEKKNGVSFSLVLAFCVFVFVVVNERSTIRSELIQDRLVRCWTVLVGFFVHHPHTHSASASLGVCGKVLVTFQLFWLHSRSKQLPYNSLLLFSFFLSPTL